jgi:hypothetical protein
MTEIAKVIYIDLILKLIHGVKLKRFLIIIGPEKDIEPLLLYIIIVCIFMEDTMGVSS